MPWHHAHIRTNLSLAHDLPTHAAPIGGFVAFDTNFRGIRRRLARPRRIRQIRLRPTTHRHPLIGSPPVPTGQRKPRLTRHLVKTTARPFRRRHIGCFGFGLGCCRLYRCRDRRHGLSRLDGFRNFGLNRLNWLARCFWRAALGLCGLKRHHVFAKLRRGLLLTRACNWRRFKPTQNLAVPRHARHPSDSPVNTGPNIDTTLAVHILPPLKGRWRIFIRLICVFKRLGLYGCAESQ